MCCADWGVPLGGNAGSSVHFRSMAKALSELGHEVRLLVSNGCGPVVLPLPVERVAYRRFWPALHGFVERLRGRGPAEAQAPSRAGGFPLLSANPRQEQEPELSPHTRLYYQELPRLLDQAEELLFHRRSFAQAVSKSLATFMPHAVYERYALGQAGAAMALHAQRNGVAHLLEVNAPLAAERVRHGALRGFWAWAGLRDEVRLWRGADRVLCVSDRLAELVARAGTDRARIRVTPNGVDVEAFTPDRPKGALRRVLGLGDGQQLIGWLGSLSPGRGAEEFLRILARVFPKQPGARGVVIGDGPLAGDCRRLAGELGLGDRVRFTGAVDHQAVPGLLVDLDIAVVCYPRQEGLYFSPMKMGEYMASGLAVVAGRTGQMLDMVTHGVDGVLVDPGDDGAWSWEVLSLCRDASKRASLGRAARARALAGPTWRKNASAVEHEILAVRRQTAARGSNDRLA